jgi:pyruvate formate lyase activating enzyme
MNEAALYEKLRDGRVRCGLCAHRCLIGDGCRGICAVRENRGGTLYSLVYGRLISHAVDPIEKKPLFHFLPGTCAYSVATVGCNFTCKNCQNYTISQAPRESRGAIPGEEVSPSEIVARAKETGCPTIAYTYTEPTVFFEYALDTARVAREEGIANVFVSNGYMTAEAAEALIPYLDGINIDLKGISDDFYHTVVGANVRPVLDSIERFFAAGVWVEVTTLVIPGMNDRPEELSWIAEAIVGVSPAIPWHISRFYPAWRLPDLPPTPVRTLEEAQRIGREAGLRYVYLGNVPGEGEDTRCPGCRRLLIKRIGFLVKENRLQDGKCPDCGFEVDGVF